MSLYTSFFAAGLLAVSPISTASASHESFHTPYNAIDYSEMMDQIYTYDNENGDSLHRGSGR